MSKRELILEATADLIAEQGIQNCPMASIAKHAGCGAGTIYRYFETKEALIEQLYLSVSEDMSEYSLQNYPKEASVRARFDHIWGRFYDFLIFHHAISAYLINYGRRHLFAQNCNKEQ